MRAASASVIVSVPKRSLFVALTIILAITFISAYRSVTKAPSLEFQKAFIGFGGRRFQVDIADTDQKRQKGLGDHVDLAADEGMLFIFEDLGEYCFWMKDVEFPIDIFWFDENMSIVESVDALSPDTYPQSFCPAKPIKYVLEIRGGESKNLDLTQKLEIEHKH